MGDNMSTINDIEDVVGVFPVGSLMRDDIRSEYHRCMDKLRNAKNSFFVLMSLLPDDLMYHGLDKCRLCETIIGDTLLSNNAYATVDRLLSEYNDQIILESGYDRLRITGEGVYDARIEFFYGATGDCVRYTPSVSYSNEYDVFDVSCRHLLSHTSSMPMIECSSGMSIDDMVNYLMSDRDDVKTMVLKSNKEKK